VDNTGFCVFQWRLSPVLSIFRVLAPDSFDKVACRNSAWPAASHIRRQTARGWTHFGWLQYPERCVNIRDGFGT
jgi:hypothetical protein